MRAMVCSRYGGVDDLVWTELPDPEPGPGTVLVDVAAAGVGFADLLVVSGRYQVRPDAPFVPGFEVSGRVAALGPGVDDLAVGDPVVAFVWHGGYAEKVVAPATQVFPWPEGFDPREAAGFLTGYMTAGHALLDRVQLTADETLVVLGASGSVGSAAVQVGAAVGARVVAVTGSDAGEALVRRLGAAAVVRRDLVADVLDVISSICDGRGVDVVVDPVGGEGTRRWIDLLAPGGRLAVVGFVAGEIPQIRLDTVRDAEVELVGVYAGLVADRFPAENRRLVDRLTRMAAAGTVRPVVGAVFPLRDAPRALRAVRDGAVCGRVVLSVR